WKLVVWKCTHGDTPGWNGAAGQSSASPRSFSILVSKSQMLTTLSPCAPVCPMRFLHALITPGYNRPLFENTISLASRFENTQENQLCAVVISTCRECIGLSL